MQYLGLFLLLALIIALGFLFSPRLKGWRTRVLGPRKTFIQATLVGPLSSLNPLILVRSLASRGPEAVYLFQVVDLFVQKCGCQVHSASRSR